MKDKITIYGDEYGKYYSVDFGNGSNNTYRDYYDAVNAISKYYNMSDFIETESREERLAREKAESREEKINMLLGE